MHKFYIFARNNSQKRKSHLFPGHTPPLRFHSNLILSTDTANFIINIHALQEWYLWYSSAWTIHRFANSRDFYTSTSTHPILSILRILSHCRLNVIHKSIIFSISLPNYNLDTSVHQLVDIPSVGLVNNCTYMLHSFRLSSFNDLTLSTSVLLPYHRCVQWPHLHEEIKPRNFYFNTNSIYIYVFNIEDERGISNYSMPRNLRT